MSEVPLRGRVSCFHSLVHNSFTGIFSSVLTVFGFACLY